MTFLKSGRAVMLAASVAALSACGGGGTGTDFASLGTGDLAAKAWTVDSAGVGFVGKGDVQLALRLNNAQLQSNADAVQFRSNVIEITEVSWTCTNGNNQNTQERERTTTIETSNLVSKVERVRNQITGFNLTGLSDSPTSYETETEGPAINSCPSGPWTLTIPAGDPQVIERLVTMEVSVIEDSWFPLDPAAQTQ